ncbi:PASTA domain-containing protein [Mycolicibacterium sphagni]|uniref:PASTA domain-containing protein n=1 Tax=Mycolicibacterium sphagni TaxID=1786 RepID=UPI0021F36317|nr:PASTA domain-containing protein [Mycolicibacterium sphagni]MCV7176756.1 PASTA domain-containing protein [Mycolicibacterium sphagni]
MPTTTSPSEGTAPTVITVPNVEAGENAQVVLDQLQKLGITKVDLTSANPKYHMVIVPSNWTVVSIEPAPGATVTPNDTVVLDVTKD